MHKYLSITLSINSKHIALDMLVVNVTLNIWLAQFSFKYECSWKNVAMNPHLMRYDKDSLALKIQALEHNSSIPTESFCKTFQITVIIQAQNMDLDCDRWLLP